MKLCSKAPPLQNPLLEDAEFLWNVPPCAKPIHAGKHLEELIFERIHVGPVFALWQIQEPISEELFLKHVFAPSQICIRTFARSLCMDTVAVFTHP